MVLSMERWKGKVAIVTGASSGIGAAVAENLVSEGLVVVGLARRKEKVDELFIKLEDKPGKLYSYKADVTKEEDILAAFQWVEENLGPVHVLVNNAGIVSRSHVHDGETAVLRSIVDTNLMAAVIGSREAIKSMRKNKVDGHIINIGSIAGHYPIKSAGSSLYAASKYAVTALTEILRQELQLVLKTKIKVTDISPGVVLTEMMPSQMELPHLFAEDIADSVNYVLSTPPHVQVHEIIVRPVGEFI